MATARWRCIATMLVFGLLACSRAQSGPSKAGGADLAFANGQLRASVDFGKVARGDTRAIRVAVTNRGTAAGRLAVGANVDAETLGFHGPTQPVTIAADATEELVFSFSPGTEAPATASFALIGESGAALTLDLTGSTALVRCALASDAPIDFGVVALGTQPELDLQLANAGELVAYVHAALEAGSDERFELLDGATEVVVGAQGQVQLTVRLRATALGPASGVLLIDGPDGCALKRVALQATVATHVETLGPASLVFPYVAVGHGVTQSLTIRNDGREACRLSNIRIDEPMFAVLNAPSVVDVPAHGSATLDVRFRPPSLGAYVARLQVDIAGAAPWTASITLTGNGGGPVAEVSPSSVDFGPAAAQNMRLRSVVVANRGQNVPATTDDDLAFGVLDGVTLTPKAPEILDDLGHEFTVSWPGDTMPHSAPPSSLNAGGSIELYVGFHRMMQGEHRATLRIYTNDVASTVIDVPLSAGPDVATCTSTVDVSEADLGLVLVGMSASATVRVRNVSSDGASCWLSGVELEPESPEFSLVAPPSGPVEIAPGGTYAFAVVFTPRDELRHTVTLRYDVNDPTAVTQNVGLSGKGSNCLGLDASELDFGSVAVGCNSTAKRVKVLNLCSAAVSLTGSVGAAATSPFALMTSSTSYSIPAGGELDIPLQFVPSSPGPVVDRLSLTAAMGTLWVRLRGEGTTQSTQIETFVAPDGPQIDFLLVLDDSPSCSDLLPAIANMFSAFSTLADGRPIDFHIGIVAGTDTMPSTLGKLLPLTGNSPRVLERRTGNVGQVFSQRVLAMGSDNGLEELGRAARLALDRPLRDTWNAGLLRPTASLALILMTDGGVWDAGLGSLVQGITARPELASVSLFGGGMDGDPIELAIQTTAGFSAHSAPDWPAALRGLTTRMAASTRRYFLSAAVDSSQPITVTVDGTPLPATGSHGETRWMIEATPPALLFAAPAEPSAGALIVVSYTPVCHP